MRTLVAQGAARVHRRPKRIVVATDSFKGTLSSLQAGRAIRAGVLRIWPDAEVVVIPMADGGEGTVEAVLTGAGGRACEIRVSGPLGEPVTAVFGLLHDGRTAVIEMAASSGLSLVPVDRRDPTRTSTFGTGRQMAAAMDAGATRLLVGIGGSATVDGGCGAAQALGVRFLAVDGSVLPPGLAGGDLDRIARIDISRRDPRLDHVEVTVLCDVTNPLCGPQGAAEVFGPQKGATPEQVSRLDRNLLHMARVIESDLGVAVADMPGAGAAGGLGAGLVAMAGAKLRSGVESVIRLTRLSDRIRGADLVITGEGRIDAQSLMGKAVSGVARCARQAGVRVVAVVGSAGPGAEQCLSILNGIYAASGPEEPVPRTPEHAMRLLTDRTARQLAGWDLG